jgi:hypothetical protein
MKIKDIINPLLSVKDKYLLAYRIRKCTDEIKSDIRVWKESGEIPDRTIVLSSPGSNSSSLLLSMQDLTKLYGLDILEAFIFMDDAIRANSKEDKKALKELLGRLKSSGCIHNGNITPKLLEQIKINQPGVWEAYQKLLAEEKASRVQVELENPLNDDI